MIKQIYFIIYFIFILMSHSFSEEIRIIYKIENSIITNFDIKNEIKYLSLNKNFNNLTQDEMFLKAEQSLLREKIKKNEIEKYYLINYKIESQSEQILNIYQSFIKNLGFNSEEEFLNYLNKNNINKEEFVNKLIIERFWNKLIYEKYVNQINVDENKIERQLKELEKNNSTILSFNLSEIVFSEKNKIDIDDKYEKIKKSIETMGFEEAALLYSISESSKLNGKIGWVNETQISDIILNEIRDLKLGEYSKPIFTAGGIIILKLNEKKEISKKINLQSEKEKMINYEKNRILNEFSIIFFNQIENKVYVEKL